MVYKQSQGGVFDLPVSDFLTSRSKLVPLKETDTVRAVLLKFKNGEPIVVVTNNNDEVTGVVTPKSVREARDALGVDQGDSVTRVMNKQVVVVYDNEPVESAALTMKKMGFDLGVPVISAITNKYVGFLFRTDISRQVDTFIKGVRSATKKF